MVDSLKRFRRLRLSRHGGRARLDLRLLAVAGLLVALTAPAYAQDAPADPALLHGKRLFLMCAACHNLHAGEGDKVGPNLSGVIGKPAGSRGSFVYSDGLKLSGIIWSPETLNTWLTKPSALVPGTKMAFPGLPNEHDRADVIAYLAEATK